MTAPGRWRRGVGIMVLDARKHVFVGRRIDVPDAWQMPQGGIDDGESPRQAAWRELKEETGIEQAEIIAESARWLRYEVPALARGPRFWGGRYRGQEQKWFAMRFLGHDGDIDLATGHAEFDAWKWVPAAALPALIVPFKRVLYEAVLAEFRDVLAA
jgi:putative (di)nucleoside polyphosphate hydrolase